MRVRVVSYNGNKPIEVIHDNLSRQSADELFVFYVRSCIELGVHISVVNLFNGKKCVRFFQNR